MALPLRGFSGEGHCTEVTTGKVKWQLNIDGIMKLSRTIFDCNPNISATETIVSEVSSFER